MMSLLPKECIGFHTRWLQDGHPEETIQDLNTRDIIKALLGFHYEMTHGNAKDILSLMEKLNSHSKHANDPHRLEQIQLAKDLIIHGRLSIVDAMFILFSREELVGED